MNRPLRAIACVLLAVSICGCGYTVHSSLDESYQTIHVVTFQNASREYGLQAALTNALIRKFLFDGRLEVVSREQADLVLEGRLLDYKQDGLIFDRDDNVTQFRTTVIAGVRLTDNRTGEVIWETQRMTGDTTYSTRAEGSATNHLRGNVETFLSSVRSFSTQQENSAASEVLERLASGIFYRTVEPW